MSSCASTLRALLGLLALAMLVGPAPADAAPIQRQATVTLGVSVLGFSGSILVSGTGTVTVDVAAQQIRIPQIASLAVTQTVAIVATGPPFLGLAGLTAIRAQPGLAHWSGTFSLGRITTASEICGAPLLSNACIDGGGIDGTARLVTAGGTPGGDDLELLFTAGVLPVLVNGTSGVFGVGGMYTHPSAADLTADGAPWTTGTGRVTFETTSTYSTVAFGMTFMGTNTFTTTTTAMGGGALGAGPSQLTLVTPIFMTALNNFNVPMVARLTVDLVPEPATLLLVATGLAGLLWIRRR